MAQPRLSQLARHLSDTHHARKNIKDQAEFLNKHGELILREAWKPLLSGMHLLLQQALRKLL